jgi:DNA-binding NarL/FixJ family response regulator
MKNHSRMRGKKVFTISQDPEISQTIRELIVPLGAVSFESSFPNEAVAGALAKNPDLIVYDDTMSPVNGLNVLSMIKHARPNFRVLLLSRIGVPLRSIDVSARGASFTLPRNAAPRQLLDAVKHCLGVVEAKEDAD